LGFRVLSILYSIYRQSQGKTLAISEGALRIVDKILEDAVFRQEVVIWSGPDGIFFALVRKGWFCQGALACVPPGRKEESVAFLSKLL